MPELIQSDASVGLADGDVVAPGPHPVCCILLIRAIHEHRYARLLVPSLTDRPGSHIGAHGARETPVPIPNTAVKPRSGYNTSTFSGGKIARCQTIVKTSRNGGLFFYLPVDNR